MIFSVFEWLGSVESNLHRSDVTWYYTARHMAVTITLKEETKIKANVGTPFDVGGYLTFPFPCFVKKIY